MNKSPRTTVYITNYNYEKYIRISIESVLSQTYQDFELLIIDDGSTDGSKDIIELYRDYEKVAIIYQQNKGLNITNNVAMRVARGKYIMRLDADDYLEPDALEVMSSKLEADDDLGLVFPDYYYVDAEGNRTGEERRHDFEREVSLYDQPAHGACTMIRLAFLRNLGGYNESFTCQDGYELWIKFITHYKVTNVSKPLFSYRQHGNNLTTNEAKILSTRKRIKELYAGDSVQAQKTLAVIPVRNTYIGEVNWPLYIYNGKTVLEHKIEVCLKAKKIGVIVVSSADPEILAFAREKIDNPRVVIVERPKAYARLNVSLQDTIAQALKETEAKFDGIEVVMTVALEFPFLTSDVIDEAVNTLAIFKADSVLSVRPDNSMYYQHIGHGMKPILDQDKFTILEREALYKGVGGVALSTRANFESNSKIASGRISHIVVDQKTAFCVDSVFSILLFDRLTTN